MTVPGNPAEWSRRGAAIVLLLLLLPVRSGLGLEMPASPHPATPPAGVVLVTAGEHGEFSRVVFALGADLPYRAEPEPTGLRIVFPGARVGFEYAAVYPKRRAHRVVMAEPGSDADGASLRLDFGCQCSARTFMLDERLVVDIFDGASGDGRLPASMRLAPQERADAQPASAGPAAGRAEPRDPVDASRQPQPRPEFLRRVDGLSGSEASTPPHLVPEGAGFDPDHLQRMLAWAIDQGHLTAAADGDGRTRLSGAHEAPAPTEDTAATGVAEPSAPSAPRALPAVAQAPEVAPEAPVAAPGPVEEEEAASCPDAGALDMAALGGSGTFAAELARRQDALSRALAADHRVAEAQHDLAGFYLARLMPQEALRLLGADGREAPGPTRSWLEAIALVLANRAGALTGRARNGPVCRGADVELWQAVLDASGGPVPPQILNNAAIQLRLAAYPPALRAELALRLAEAAIDANASEAIGWLLDMVEQAAPTDEARARMLFLRGRLAAARGDFAGAWARWREAQHLPGEGGLWATLALLSSELERDALDEAGALAALDRLSYDWRGHPAQLNIARLSAAIHERQGRVSLALRAIEEVALAAEGRPGGRAAARLATDLMRRTYADAPPALPMDQLAAFWRYEGFVPPGSEGADVRLAFARVLIAQGLPNAAARLLERLAGDALGPLHDEVTDLLAEAYLADRQPARVLELLRAPAREASASRPGRNLLAARALAGLGRFAEAAGVLHGGTGEGTARLQADYLWKAGLWREATSAYRAMLGDSEQGSADPEDALRLAAAAYMAGTPELERPPSTAEAGNAGIESSASGGFAASTSPHGTGRSMAAQLLDQAAGLSELATRYGLGSDQIP